MEINLLNVRFLIRKGLLINIMKTFILFVCTTVFSFSSSKSFSQEKVLIGQDQLVTIDQVFKIIKKQTNYRFIYPKKAFKGLPKVQLKKGEIELSELLKKSLSSNNLSFELTASNNILIKKNTETGSTIEKSQKIVINGTVIAADGQPLQGATILEKGTVNGTVTDEDGNFTLTVSDQNSILQVSYIGYLNQEIVVGTQTIMNVILESDLESLTEVVVTGYQTLSKERVTGSFSNIKSVDLNRVVSDNVVNKLEGMAPGVLVQNDGNGNTNLTIRGQSTLFGSTSPLIVVDGFPITTGADDIDMSSIDLEDINGTSDFARGNLFGSINPRDIKRITVLKDAAAASIWGVRSANGVIVIETYNGKGGVKDKVNVRYSYDLTIGNRKPDLADFQHISSEEQINFELEAYEKGMHRISGNYNPFLAILRERDVTNSISAEEANNRIQELGQRDIMGQFSDYFLRKESKQEHNIAISGHSEKTNYMFSAVYNDNKYTSTNKTKKNLLLRGTFGMKDVFTDNLDIELNYTAGFTTNKNNHLGIDEYKSVQPYDLFVDESGNKLPQWISSNRAYPHQYQEYLDKGYLDWTFNQLQEFEAMDNVTKSNLSRLQGKLNYRVNDNIQLRTSYQFEKKISLQEDFQSMERFDVRQAINALTHYDPDTGPQYNFPRKPRMKKSTFDIDSWIWRNEINFNYNVFELGEINGLIGGEIQKITGRFNNQDVWGFDPVSFSVSPIDFKTLSAVGLPGYSRYNYRMTIAPNQFNTTDDRYVSGFANLGFTWDNKYDLTLSGRFDKTNFFGTDPKLRYAPFWSVGGGWILSKENFLQNANWLDYLKLRGTYGLNGNVSSREGLVMIAGYGFWPRNGSDERFSYPLSLPNPRLRWEKVANTNIGLDFSILKNSVWGSIEYYKKYSKDIFAHENTDPTYTTYITSMGKNFGEIVNNGLDLQLNAKVIRNNDFQWKTTLNFSTNSSEVLKAETSENYGPSKSSEIHIVGDPVDALYAYRYDGLDEDGYPLIHRKDGEFAGSRDFESELVKDVVGVYNPKIYGGFINTFNYKRFEFSFTLSYKTGHVLRGPFGGINTYYMNMHFPLHESVTNRWKEPGDEATTNIPGLGHSSSDRTRRYKTRYQYGDKNIDDASSIRLKFVTLGYTLPSKLFVNSVVKSVHLSAQISNAWLWVANKYGVDPEYYGGRLNGSIINVTPPPTTTFSVNVNF